ncbi:MAG: sensor histidine kinase [Actinomycetota bacterium]
MKSRETSVWPWIVFGSTVLVMGGAIWIGLNNKSSGVGQLNPVDILWATSWLALPAVGALIASRRPGNKIGWLACAFGLPIAVLLFANEYARYALISSPGSLPGGRFMFWLSQWPFFVSGGIAVFLFLLFPDGTLPSRRWRPIGWIAVGATIAGALAASFGRSTEVDMTVENPLAIRSLAPLLETVQEGAGATLLALIAVSVLSTLLRFRRSRGESRQQVKWLLFGLVFMFMMFGFLFVIEEVLHTFSETIQTILFVLGVLGPPAGIAVAVLKYRLYEIDVIINKTVVYGALAAFITAVYVGVVVGIGTLVGAGGKPNLALSLAATAIVAVAFQPVRERVQRFANKLVYGERVTPYEAITGFSHRMAESLSLDSVLPQMAEAAAKGVGGVRSRVKLILPGGGERVVDWPGDSTDSSFDRTLAVVHQGEQMGEISVSKSPGEQINKNEDKLLSDLASQAGLAMRNLRLTAELQQKLVELQESRKRIVKAQDEERRRMERDIHDGAQQQLVSMSVKLGLVGNLLSRDVQRAGTILEELRGEASEAVETLRDLARGLFPEVLTDSGLVAALESHIAKTGLNATVQGESSRFDLEIEANVYFCIREALQNASKHAPSASILITLLTENDDFAFSVKDDGPGFDLDSAGGGSGLQNMRDRIEALGGTLGVESRPGTGTSVVGSVPAGQIGDR